jgi:hypothetical protein
VVVELVSPRSLSSVKPKTFDWDVERWTTGGKKIDYSKLEGADEDEDEEDDEDAQPAEPVDDEAEGDDDEEDEE